MLSRRRILDVGAAAALLPALVRIAAAQSYPERSVRVIVGFAAGGSIDIFARLVCQSLSEQIGQAFIIDNRAGAGGSIATEAVVRSAPDGYTLLMIGVNNATNPTLYDNLKYDFLQDIVPIASTVRGVGVLIVNPDFPAKTVPELIAYAKANPGKINMGSSGTGTPQHLYGELFVQTTGTQMQHVPYRGSPASLTAIFAGDVQVMFDTLSTSIEHIKAGKLRALAVTSARRIDALPDVPAVSEFVPGYEATSWQGFGAPKGTSLAIIDKLNGAINAVLADPAIKARIETLGYSAFTGSPADFTKLIAAETEKWGKVIRAANIRLN
jgi:tripartite-type tricarboxylate transporter receptor subunit TctC